MELLICAVVVLFVLLLLSVGFNFKQHYHFDKKMRERADELAIQADKYIEDTRKTALRNQRNNFTGKLFERFAIWHDEFPFNRLDVYPLYGTAPVDFIVFKGLSESNGEHCDSVDFVDFKSGSSGKLTHSQRAIREAVDHGRVGFFKLYNIDGIPKLEHRVLPKDYDRLFKEVTENPKEYMRKLMENSEDEEDDI